MNCEDSDNDDHLMKQFIGRRENIRFLSWKLAFYHYFFNLKLKLRDHKYYDDN